MINMQTDTSDSSISQLYLSLLKKCKHYLAKAHLDEFGYCLLANALTSKQVEALRTRLIEQAAAEKQQGLAHEDGGKDKNSGINQRVWMLINKGEIFHEPLLHKRVHELIGHVLGEQYLLSCYTRQYRQAGRRSNEFAHRSVVDAAADPT